MSYRVSTQGAIQYPNFVANSVGGVFKKNSLTDF